MTLEDLREAAAPVRAAKARQIVARLDYLRGLRQMVQQATQADVGHVLGVTQPAVSLLLKDEAKLPAVPEGFHGGDPEEIITRFTAGELTREQVIDELVRWPYAKSSELDGPLDDIFVTAPGSFDMVVRAARRGVLPMDVYDEILRRSQAPLDAAS